MSSEHLNDGVKLETAWHHALAESLTYFRALLASSDSTAWKPLAVLPLTASSTASDTGKSRSKDCSLGQISASDVKVHRRSGKGGEVFRAVVECDAADGMDPERFLGTLTTPELRPHWDRMVEGASTLELLDTDTRVTKTKYRLGWPSSPRDAVTISKTFRDTSTLIDISTSLPRSKHEPAYLRPAPPYVRAHCTLLAWCVQTASSGDDNQSDVPCDKVRITCFWQWNPKGTWAVGGGVPQHMPSMLVGLVDHIREGSDHVPVLIGYGKGVAMGSVAFDTARGALSVNYSIINEPEMRNESAESSRSASTLQGAEALHTLRERRRLERKIEFSLSSSQSWDIRINVRSHYQEDSDNALWTSSVERCHATPGSAPQIVLRFSHPPLELGEDLARVSVSVERTSSSGSSSSLRINGIPVPIQDSASRSLQPTQPRLLRSSPSVSGISMRTMSTANNSFSRPASLNSDRTWTSSRRDRSPAADKNLAGLIRRNYIYFTSLLQEPEAKWKPVSESRGVAVHQLDSIDKTLVVYRAEATFIDVGVWDLFATIFSPGTRVAWDKSHEDAVLLDDVNELTDLWLFKSRAAWPVSARDSVMLRTTYKSPSSVHIFGFSTDDAEMFPNIPASIDPAIIRTQIDLQGWSIEALSPNTTQVTLLEQSDPRGWSNKSSIPQVMINAVAGIGDFAIKAGGPPTATRFGSARALSSRYDKDRELYKLEYEAAPQRTTASSSIATSFPLPVAVIPQATSEAGDGAQTPMPGRSSMPLGPFAVIECELRCDPDKWSNNIALVVDPPPSNVSALRRHRLSSGGGGLWLTIEHDMAALADDKVSITVRKAGPQANKDKVFVTVNGGKVKVDVEDIPEADVKLLKKQKRTAPTRAPLDQPAALGTLRKRTATGNGNDSAPSTPALGIDIDPFKTLAPSTTMGRFGYPFTKLYSMAAESTKAAIVPMVASPKAPSGTKPAAAAFDALARLRRMHAERATETTEPFGWVQVSDRDGLIVDRKVVPYVSDSFPVFRTGKIIEGFMAEEVSAVISSNNHRREWDERLATIAPLQSFGSGITTTIMTSRCTFPFKDRAFVTASVVSRTPESIPSSPSMTTAGSSSMATIFHTSTSSFDAASMQLDLAKANPYQCPFGSVILEGWVLETIDPYGHEQYAIPSTRCVYVVAVDYGGSIPVSVNNMLNASLPRNVLGVELALRKGGTVPSLRRPVSQIQMPAQAEEHIAEDGSFTLCDLDETRVLLHEIVKTNGAARFMIKIRPSNQPQPPPLLPRLSSASPSKASALSPPEALTPRQGLKQSDSKLSVNTIASRTSNSTVIDLAGEIRRAAAERDFIVAEFVLDSSRYPNGYDIGVSCALLEAVARRMEGSETELLPLDLAAKDTVAAQFKSTIVALAPTVLQSAMLDPGAASERHLVRITIPTSLYDTPIADPLTGESAPVETPEWLRSIIEQGALIKCTLTPKSAAGAGGANYTCGDTEVVVEDERQAMGSRAAARIDPRIRLPRLQRVSADEAQMSLQDPVAVAFQLLPSATRASVDSTDRASINNETKSIQESTELNGEPLVGPKTKDDGGSRAGSVSAPAGRYSFWEYSRRITGFGSASTPGTPGSHQPPSLFPAADDTLPPPPTPLISPEDVVQVVATETDLKSSQHTSLMGPVVSLPALVLIIIFSMLVGSLLRSLLSDADFVVFLPEGTPIPSGQGHAWKDLRRLLELKGWGVGWDLVIAAVRRH